MKALVLTGYLAVVSCDTIVNPTQQVVIGSPSPAPGVGGVPLAIPPRIDRVAVEIFEQFGCTGPPVGGATILVGCIVRITATPQLEGAAVPPELHGATCAWFLDGRRIVGSASTDTVYITATDNPFNLVAHAQGPGTFTLEAEVQAVRSGPRAFTVR